MAQIESVQIVHKRFQVVFNLYTQCYQLCTPSLCIEFISKEFPVLAKQPAQGWAQLVFLCAQLSFQAVHHDFSCCVCSELFLYYCCICSYNVFHFISNIYMYINNYFSIHNVCVCMCKRYELSACKDYVCECVCVCQCE